MAAVNILDSSALGKRLKLQHGFQLLSISPAWLFSAIPIIEPVGKKPPACVASMHTSAQSLVTPFWHYLCKKGLI